MTEIIVKSEYREWLKSLKDQIKSSQIKATVSVNSQLIMLYWDLGRQINEKQEQAQWGSKFIENLSKDLKAEFPNITGFSKVNLLYMKRFYLYYLPITQNELIVHQPGEQLHLIDNNEDNLFFTSNNINKLFIIPWKHHVKIIEKVKEITEAIFYIEKTIENNWSRSVLEYQIETNLFKRQGKATTNFKLTMPEPDSDLANSLIKDEYNFEFLQLSEKVKETDIEKALTQHMAQFLTELGKGFAYMGRQYPIKVGTKDFKIDLLFYHTKLKCYIVIELKVREFDPAFTGKLVFYTTAVDKLLRDETDKPTIGILLCKEKDDVVVDYALENIRSPLGVGKMKLVELDEETKAMLPTIEELQNELLNFVSKEEKYEH
jgi:predicted nuclease of restriction endonuclease-like (RecB) superfamily